MHAFDVQAEQILRDRYLLKDDYGKVIEEIDVLPHRVALGVAQDIEDVSIYEELMRSGRFLPNSPCIANAGRGSNPDEVLKWLNNKKAGDTLSPMPHRGGQLSACFVLPVMDDLEAIFDAVKWAARIHQTAGGTGFNFSRLRYEGAIVHTSGGKASGPISFMSVFDKATSELKQGGFRRGANMGVLNCRHKDIRKFVTCKADVTKITNFNISVAVDDEFMRKALDESLSPEERRYGLYDFSKEEALRDENGNVMTEDAKEVLELIIEQAWKTGEPGLLFWTTIERGNPLGDASPLEAVNPCGEQPLPKNGSCVLGSMNTSAQVLPDGSDFNWEQIDADAAAATRFLDDMVDVNMYTLPQIEERAMADRRTGLGIMGLAHAFIKLGVRYGSEESFVLADKLMSFINRASLRESERLGHVRGSFGLFEQSVYPSLGYTAMRNGTRLTIAPTGTISTLLGTSSGAEPLFALGYTRNVVGGDPIYVVEPLFIEALQARGLYTPEIIEKVAANHWSCQGIEEIPTDIQHVFVTAHDITPEEHVKMQTTLQKHIDSAISKTINMPEEATMDDVRRAYTQAWKNGAKGITVYRNNSRPNQTLEIGVKKEKKSDALSVELQSLMLDLLQKGTDPEKIVEIVGDKLRAVQPAIEIVDSPVVSLKDLAECPVCGAGTKHEEKCTSCSDPTCGWSACHVA